MPEDENEKKLSIAYSEKVFNSMTINDLLTAYEANQKFPGTKIKIRQEILHRMNISTNNKSK